MDKLLGRVVAPNASSIRMEWAADVKLSKDGNKLYGVPSEYLTVGKDGEVLMPDVLENDANVAKTYQYKTGHYIQRNNLSEGPDAEENTEHNLLNGGVKLSQIAFLPKKLNMDVLQKKAQDRLPEEERLKQDSKDFYKVEYPKDAPQETKESLNEKYNALNSAFHQQKQEAVYHGIQNEVLNGAFAVEPKYREGYFREIKQLAENMKSKDRRTDAYIRYYDAIQKAAKIDPNARDVDEKIAKANKEILESIKNYTAGKEKVRTFQGGRERFANAMERAQTLIE